jgi:hypothetical protein
MKQDQVSALDLSPVTQGAQSVLAVPYKQAALATDILVKQVEDYLRNPGPSNAQRRQLKDLRDQLCSHRAKTQMDLFSMSTADGA